MKSTLRILAIASTAAALSTSAFASPTAPTPIKPQAASSPTAPTPIKPNATSPTAPTPIKPNLINVVFSLIHIA